MTLSKSLLVLGAVTTIGAVGFIGANTVSAQGSNQDSLASKIATKFNLNKNDVQKVVDEQRSEHMANMQAKFNDRLTQAVKDGKITEDQKTKIIAKQAEMKTFIDGLKDKTPAERHTAMEAKKTELIQWAKDNNIDQQYIMQKLGGYMGGRHMGNDQK